MPGVYTAFFSVLEPHQHLVPHWGYYKGFLRYHLGVFASKPFLSGALIWNLRDFRVKPGWAGGNPLPNPPVNQKGLVDDLGRRKPAWNVVRQIYRSTGPFR